MSGMVWCICSSGRPEMLKRKTLATLARGNFEGSVYVVVPSEELAVYSQALATADIHCIILHCQKGLVNQRKYFRDQMLPGTEIVFIDDDIEAIKIKTPTGLKHCTNIVGGAHAVFEMIAATPDCLLAGVYPMANRDWMTTTVAQANAFVVGALYFCINDARLKEPETDELEDWYRCLSEQAAGRPVLRINWIGIITQYWKNAGGMQEENRIIHREGMVARMAAEFHTLVKQRKRRDGKANLMYLAKPVMAATGSSPVQSTPEVPPAESP
jgi:hypothetical protein